ncbi:hypothetical protein M0813_12770 [Anaeramoeba flamelloides]|uniref:Uncharacterized protein n=1 Tax=Anaeramoeba flamelloides TaxID=1746091 RepID=A0ABQ8ZBD8_9EUKA|nr:hypothetical protein M0813_12770 [Anaeramoeba flamelloides]
MTNDPPLIYTTLGKFESQNNETRFLTKLPLVHTQKNLSIGGLNQPKLPEKKILVVVLYPSIEFSKLLQKSNQDGNEIAEKGNENVNDKEKQKQIVNEKEKENEKDDENENENEKENEKQKEAETEIEQNLSTEEEKKDQSLDESTNFFLRDFLDERGQEQGDVSKQFPNNQTKIGSYRKKKFNRMKNLENESKLPTSDVGLYITMFGFLLMYCLGDLLSSLVTYNNQSIRFVLSVFGTLAMLSSPLIYLKKKHCNLKHVLRLQKGALNLKIIFFAITISVGMMLGLFILSSLMFISIGKSPSTDQSMKIDTIMSAFLGVIAVAVMPGFCEGLYFFVPFFMPNFFFNVPFLFQNKISVFFVCGYFDR